MVGVGSILTLSSKVTMKLSRMVVLVLMVQTCIDSLAIILHFICPDCITGFSSSQTDQDRFVSTSSLPSLLFKYFYLTMMRVL